MLQRGKEVAVPQVVPVASRDSERARRQHLLCVACGQVITTGDARLAVDGAHVHTRTNPDGFTFTFGCFATAPGCVAQGVPSRQASWFPGYFWWTRACASCQGHLGWLFFADVGEFYGLVLDRLHEVEA